MLDFDPVHVDRALNDFRAALESALAEIHAYAFLDADVTIRATVLIDNTPHTLTNASGAWALTPLPV